MRLHLKYPFLKIQHTTFHSSKVDCIWYSVETQIDVMWQQYNFLLQGRQPTNPIPQHPQATHSHKMFTQDSFCLHAVWYVIP